MTPQESLGQALKVIERGALVCCHHSGGKDSQAMLLYLSAVVPREQLVIVHSVLPEVEWEGIPEHIQATSLGLPVHMTQAGKTLLDVVRKRGMFPSPSRRWCTSDLKRSPLEKLVRGLVRERVERGHPSAKLVLNAMGMRKQESCMRAKLEPLKLSTRNSVAGREWYDWLPIHDWSEEQVFARIAQAGQKPHWVYAKGMSRCSCSFCVMSSKQDLTTAAKLNPALYRTYVELERSTGQVMMMPTKKAGRLTLEQITGIAVATPCQGVARPSPMLQEQLELLAA